MASAKKDAITLKEIATDMASDYPTESVSGRLKFLQGFVGKITEALMDGVKVKIPEFGILQVKDRPARMGRNPATGETIKIKASKKIGFRPAKGLKEAVL